MRPKNGRFIRGNPFFFSTPPLVLFGAGSPFFIRFECGAVLYFRCWARGGAPMFFVVFGRLGRLFGFAVSWLCECRLSHLDGGCE